MIRRLARNIACFCVRRAIVRDDEIEVYSYGFELLLSTLMNAISVFFVGILLGVLLESFIFMISFAILRTMAGGYHAKTHKLCINIFLFAVLGFALIIITLPDNYIMPYIIVCAVTSALIIYFQAPVEAVNKPLPPAKRERLRKYCLILSCAHLVLALFFCLTPVMQTSLVTFYFSGTFAASLSLLAAVITKHLGETKKNI